MTISPVRIGPSGWEHADWEGVIYPRRSSSRFHPLEFLAGPFDTVEIESTFRQPVRPEVARLWLKMVSHNPGFQFTARLDRRFTHDRELDPAGAAEFSEGLRVIQGAGKLECLVMQFPWAFRFTGENREYLIQLRRTFHEFPIVVEMRHASWMAEEALGTFIDYRLGFANIDQPEYTKAMPPTAYVTSSVGCVRLHGRNPVYWQREFGNSATKAGDYLYPLSVLEEWKSRIQHVAAHSAATYVILTNDVAGKSAVNALQLRNLIVQSPPSRQESTHRAA